MYKIILIKMQVLANLMLLSQFQIKLNKNKGYEQPIP